MRKQSVLVAVCTALLWVGTVYAGVCVPTGPEVCDGIDNDCNGAVDDGLGTTTCGVGACTRTVDNCVGGVPQTCTPGVPSPEVCDGLDNDCNGSVDDGGVCAATLDCTNAVANPATLWPPKHKYAKVSVEGVVDADGNPAAITVTGITQDEPLAGKGYGQTCTDGAGVGTDTALVRPERATSHHSSRDGRVYHISFSADDGHGGQCTGTVAVCVPLKKADKKGHKGGTCVDEGPLFDSTGPCK